MSIPDPKQYVQTNFPDGLLLATCSVSNAIIQQVDASVDHVLSNNSWLDAMVRSIYHPDECVATSSAYFLPVQTLVEFQLSPKDAVALLKACPSFVEASKDKKVLPLRHTRAKLLI